jgi:hypothetical protein
MNESNFWVVVVRYSFSLESRRGLIKNAQVILRFLSFTLKDKINVLPKVVSQKNA